MTDIHAILVDWGTSNLRLWAVSATGAVLSERRSDKGMSKLTPDAFAPVLNTLITEIGAPEATPVLMCGMVGAAQGWQEAPYLSAPTKLDSLSEAVIPLLGQNRDIRIIPGIAQKTDIAPDVMRGEETLLLGLNQADGQIVMPGTHSKWVQMQAGSLAQFQTVMTGELFHLIETQSILSKTLANTDWDDADFITAAQNAYQNPGNILTNLFSLRAAPLLFGETALKGGRAKLSGWLIGAEIASCYKPKNGAITLLSDGNLAALYDAAFTALNIPFTRTDASQAAQRGLIQIASDIWPSHQ